MKNSHNLGAVFSPSSVAVIGASRKRGTIGAEIFRNLLEHSFQGVVYPVNPTAAFVQAVQAYPKITDIPGPVDLAVVVVPKERVLETVRDCARKGVKGLVVISAGFKETGELGLKLERELVSICKEAGMRLVGPNCLGILNTDPKVQLDATFSPTYPPSGNVAFSSQSGGLGLAILDFAHQLGIGISHFVSVGNKADVSGNDLIEYWADDPRTDVILLYLESFGNPRRFLEIAKSVGRKKPIVAVKSGRSVKGAQAAASHTGSLAGSEAMVNSIFHQTGAIRVDSVAELFDTAMILANQPLPEGNRIAVLTNAGGPGIMATDACEAWGLVLPELASATIAKLKGFLPSEASVKNPVDMIASASAESYKRAIPILLEDPAIDALLAIYVPPVVTTASEVAKGIVEGSERASKPVVTCFMGTHGVPEGLRSLKKGHLPSYPFPEQAVAAMARVSEYALWRKRPQGKLVEFTDFKTDIIENISTKSGWLSPTDCFSLLAAAGLKVAGPKFATSPEEAAKIAGQIGFPVVLKIDSPKILHKTEVGGVALNLRSDLEVQEAAQAMLDRAQGAGVNLRDITGFILQPMIEGGEEIIIGAKVDPNFGPLLMFGMGGVQVELMRDVAFRLSPMTDTDVKEMIAEVRSSKLLTGFRGRPPGDIAAVEEMILRLSKLAGLLPRLQEFDLNPIKVMVAGKGAIIVDARFRFAD